MLSRPIEEELYNNSKAEAVEKVSGACLS